MLRLLKILFLSALGLPRYIKDFFIFRKKGRITNIHPVSHEFKSFAGSASGQYFHQDLIIAQKIFQKNPTRHIDVGSRIDGFIAHLASFRKVECFDIRPLLDSGHENILFEKKDIMLEQEENQTDSLSCLHTLEHFGLGRYGDRLDPEGHIKGFRNLVKMLKPNGTLYISVPISNVFKVHFNSHRSFHPKDVLEWDNESINLIEFDYVDDSGALHKNFDLINFDVKINKGLGIYTFKKII
jgi:hypothetical protein